MSNYNRELSQLARHVTVSDTANQVSIGASLQLTGGGHIGIGSDVTENSIDATGPIKGTRLLAADTPQGASGLSLRAHGSGTNYGLLKGEGNTISFTGSRNDDGRIGAMAFIKNIAEGDLGASWPNALTFGVRRFAGVEEVLRITSAGKVGVGSTAPVSQVDVNGDVRINKSGRLLLGESGSETFFVDADGNLSARGFHASITGAANEGGTIALSLSDIIEGSTFLVTMSRSPTISSVLDGTLTMFNISQDGSDINQFNIVGSGNPTDTTLTVSYSSGTITFQLVNGGIQRIRMTVLRLI